MAGVAADRLRGITTFPQLVRYLRDELGWPIESESFEDLTFDYEPAELGLDPGTAAKVRKIKQLRPLSAGQPWGIFFIDFEPKQLPVVALRRILSHLVLKKRQTATAAHRASWQLHDLLFISSYGEDAHRDLAFAHFAEDQEGMGDLPVLKVLDWDDEDTVAHLEYSERTLKEKLRWPDDEGDLEGWRKGWSAAFTLRPREVITTAKKLSVEMADLARRIRRRVNTVLRIETEHGPMRKLMAAFKEALIHDLSADDFADMYAQTVTYGLLAARVSRPAVLVADNLADMVPVTNPFLRDLLSTFLKVGGRKAQGSGGVDFDELGINEVVQALREAAMDAVLRDFDDKNPREDPVIHFYELFLKEYDPNKRTKRGVFYTPRPVVSFIVRSVDELLRTEFGLADGLADTTTWAEMAKRHADLKVPEGAKLDDSFVCVLDPAAGTGTFLVEVIDVVHETMLAKWRGQRLDDEAIRRTWNEYVADHLLPRLYGFELLMAPYAIAHMKIGLKLAQTGYAFAEHERVRVYLTNSLEPPQDFSDRLEFDVPALAHEAQAVNAVKRQQRFTVVMGNPPYSPSISEPLWLMRLLGDWKRGLKETKSDLNREEWKFLRFGQHLCAASRFALLGFIINRDFLDGITKRGMREHLGQTFPLRIAVDLNGDVKGNIADENVFEIEQGVTIAVLCTRRASPELRFTSRVGTRVEKYSDLMARTPIDQDLVTVTPVPPYFRWLPFSSSAGTSVAEEYAAGRPINEAFDVYSSGIQTKRDALCVALSKEELWARVTRLHSLSAEAARREFDLGEDGRDWGVAAAKSDLASSGPKQSYISPLLYRPFDMRFTYWTGRTKGFLAYPRREVMQHVIGHRNVGMIFNRQIVGESVSHFGVSRLPICHGTFYLGNKGQDYFAPLALHAGDLMSYGSTGRSNLSASFLSGLCERLGVREAEFSPGEVFQYIYAVVHSPGYRTRYAEFLKLDFPRIPLCGDLGFFHNLAHLGSELVALHLMESPKLDHFLTLIAGKGASDVAKGYPRFADGKVYINPSRWFEGVPEAVWNFHIGGYQVCEKWLKDRRGRVLTKEDLIHYQKIVVALNETIRLMKEIDEVIDTHGGWPSAFVAGREN